MQGRSNSSAVDFNICLELPSGASARLIGSTSSSGRWSQLVTEGLLQPSAYGAVMSHAWTLLRAGFDSIWGRGNAMSKIGWWESHRNLGFKGTIAAGLVLAAALAVVRPDRGRRLARIRMARG